MPRETRTRQKRTLPTGDPHRGEDPIEDPPPEGRATQGTHTEHTQTTCSVEGFRVNQAYFSEWEFGLARNRGLTLTPGAQG